jgi:hypothetical protein
MSWRDVVEKISKGLLALVTGKEIASDVVDLAVDVAQAIVEPDDFPPGTSYPQPAKAVAEQQRQITNAARAFPRPPPVKR